MRTLILLAVSVVLFGCGPKDEPVPTASTPAADGGVAPMAGGAAGAMSPVSGGESVDGAGMGGVGSAAKDMARSAAAKTGAGPSAGGGEGGE